MMSEAESGFAAFARNTEMPSVDQSSACILEIRVWSWQSGFTGLRSLTQHNVIRIRMRDLLHQADTIPSSL